MKLVGPGNTVLGRRREHTKGLEHRLRHVRDQMPWPL